MSCNLGPYARFSMGYRIQPIDEWVTPNFSQQGLRCGQFELNYHKCMEAFGLNLGVRYCDLEWRDFMECITGDKKVGEGVGKIGKCVSRAATWLFSSYVNTHTR